jgi:hypothetical protein
MMSMRAMLGGLALVSLLSCQNGCGVLDFKPRQQGVVPYGVPPAKAEISDGYSWSLPDWVQPSARAGLVAEEAAPDLNVSMRVVDLTWRQLNPNSDDTQINQTETGSAEKIQTASLQDQLSEDGPFWMRVWASGIDWAPEWVRNNGSCTQGTVPTIGQDYNSQAHLPLWDTTCVWTPYKNMMNRLYSGYLSSNSNFSFLLVPGGFAWCEFDFELITNAADNLKILTLDMFRNWFQQAMLDLVTIFGDQANKLVYTGRDYPAGPWGADDDLFALDAVEKGMGIRLTDAELFNYHNNQLPSCGASIANNGHVEFDEAAPIRQGGRLVVAELTCFDEDCDYTHPDDPEYVVRLAVLKALQLRVNYLLVLPQQSYLATYPSLWKYVRLSLGKKPSDSPDAWVVLRESEDTFWKTNTSISWTNSPWVINLERFLVQRDVSPDGISQRGSEFKDQVLSAKNGSSYEGRKTNYNGGSDFLYFDISDQFLLQNSDPVELQITFLDQGDLSWWVEYAGVGGRKKTESVKNQNSGQKKTASFLIQDGWFDNSLPGQTDFCIYNGGAGDVEIHFVRLIKQKAP